MTRGSWDTLTLLAITKIQQLDRYCDRDSGYRS
jgi:hypothetical protein